MSNFVPKRQGNLAVLASKSKDNQNGETHSPKDPKSERNNRYEYVGGVQDSVARVGWLLSNYSGLLTGKSGTRLYAMFVSRLPGSLVVYGREGGNRRGLDPAKA